MVAKLLDLFRSIRNHIDCYNLKSLSNETILTVVVVLRSTRNSLTETDACYLITDKTLPEFGATFCAYADR